MTQPNQKKYKPAPQIFLETEKQMIVLNLLFAAMDAGREITLKQLWESVPYHPVSRQSVKGTVNYLERHGYITKTYGFGKERGPWKLGAICYLAPSPAAYAAFRPTPKAPEM